MGLLERGIIRLEKKIRPSNENHVVIIHFVDPNDGDQAPNRWWVEEDRKVVEFASESEAVEYSGSLEARPMVMCELRQLRGGT